jgi:L-alanine-DL-glutamate epimerase-like enolase superfamily enzyme
MQNSSRRDFLKTAAGLAALAGGSSSMSTFHAMATTAKGKVKITDVKVMILQGPRTYTLVKVTTDSGLFGIGEGYGSPGVGVKEGILVLRPYFIGKDPLDVEALYLGLGQRVDGSAHMLLRAVSGVEPALWDLCGKILNVPVSTLLGGAMRNSVRMYHDEGPRDMMDKASCRDWADRMKAHPAGWTAFKIGPQRGGGGAGRGSAAGASGGGGRGGRGGAAAAAADAGGADEAQTQRTGLATRELSTKELIDIQRGFENTREAIGWDYDIMFHGNWSYNLISAIKLAQALEAVKPLWIEDSLPPDYSDAWTHLTSVSKVPILTGENLGRRQTWVDFFSKKGVHIGQLDVRNVGGLLEAKKISDLADLNLIPMCSHNSASIVCNFAAVQWAASVRDFLAAETMIGNGTWMDDVILHDGPIVKNSHIALPDKPGIGIELNPDVVKAHLAPGENWWG